MIDHEIEIKADLQNRTYYLSLLEYLKEKKLITEEIAQDNYFFDTANWDLVSSGLVLRLRIEDKKAIITLKGLGQRDRFSVARYEINEEIPIKRADSFMKEGLPARELPTGLLKVLPGNNTNAIYFKKLHFSNRRTKVDYQHNDFSLLLEIDKTRFADGNHDYELEAELRDHKDYNDTMSAIEYLLAECQIPAKIQKSDKFGRAIMKLKAEDRPSRPKNRNGDKF
jgi:uncharacterized protein YjbK